jgi:hypothetical protein
MNMHNASLVSATKKLTEAEYLSEFGPLDHAENYAKVKFALQTALENRKFEIDLYWKRAAYFWAFIAATFLAFGTIVSRSDTSNPHYGLQEMFAGLGCTLSAAWWYVNKGSRFWQVHWEHQVDLLEDAIQGPIYKTIFLDKTEEGAFIGARTYSVTKLNQIVVLDVVGVWPLLLLNSAAHLSPFLHSRFHQLAERKASYDLAAVLGFVLPLVAMLCLRSFGRSKYRAEMFDGKSGLLRRL